MKFYSFSCIYIWYTSVITTVAISLKELYKNLCTDKVLWSEMLSWLYQECWKETLALSNETKGIGTSRKYVPKYIFEPSTINRVAQF